MTDYANSPPAFDRPLHVGRPNLPSEAQLNSRISQMLKRAWLTNDGPLVREFEAEVARVSGTRHCVAMVNATVALEIVFRAAELTGEVIVPSYTFVATAHALQWQEITPVFCDIDAASHTLDPAAVERLITPLTSAIVGVHLWGQACNVDALADIARERGIKLIFDAAHAFGCTHADRPIGGFGLAEVFSFHATKFVNCAEGGAVVTDSDELAARMRLMRNFGFSGYDRVIYLGTNGKMSELSAAMGLASLENLDMFMRVNRRNYDAYRTALAKLPGVSLIDHPEDERRNYQYVVLDVDPQRCPLTRDQLIQVLHHHNVLARRYFYPGVHRMEPYRSRYPDAHLQLPVTEAVVERVIVLPTGTAISMDDIERIGQILNWACANAPHLSVSLPSRTVSGGPLDGTIT